MGMKSLYIQQSIKFIVWLWILMGIIIHSQNHSFILVKLIIMTLEFSKLWGVVAMVWLLWTQQSHATESKLLVALSTDTNWYSEQTKQPWSKKWGWIHYEKRIGNEWFGDHSKELVDFFKLPERFKWWEWIISFWWGFYDRLKELNNDPNYKKNVPSYLRSAWKIEILSSDYSDFRSVLHLFTLRYWDEMTALFLSKIWGDHIFKDKDNIKAISDFVWQDPSRFALSLKVILWKITKWWSESLVATNEFYYATALYLTRYIMHTHPIRDYIFYLWSSIKFETEDSYGLALFWTKLDENQEIILNKWANISIRTWDAMSNAIRWTEKNQDALKIIKEQWRWADYLSAKLRSIAIALDIFKDDPEERDRIWSVVESLGKLYWKDLDIALLLDATNGDKEKQLKIISNRKDNSAWEWEDDRWRISSERALVKMFESVIDPWLRVELISRLDDDFKVHWEQNLANLFEMVSLDQSQWDEDYHKRINAQHKLWKDNNAKITRLWTLIEILKASNWNQDLTDKALENLDNISIFPAHDVAKALELADNVKTSLFASADLLKTYILEKAKGRQTVFFDQDRDLMRRAFMFVNGSKLNFELLASMWKWEWSAPSIDTSAKISMLLK